MINFIILAAGRGSRLKEISNDKPKALFNFLGKPLLKYQLNVLQKYNRIKKFLVTGYKAELFFEYRILFEKIFNNKYFLKTNMVYSLFRANELFDGKNDIIISYGDIIYEQKIIDKLILSKNKISVVVDRKWKKLWSLRMSSPMDDIESLKIDSKNYISNIGEKVTNYDQVEAQYIGLIKIRKDFAKKFYSIWKEKKFNSKMYMTDFLQFLINYGVNIKPIFIQNGWLEFDTPLDVKSYSEAHKNNTLKPIIDVESFKND